MELRTLIATSPNVQDGSAALSVEYLDLLARQRADFERSMLLGARAARWNRERLAAHRQAKLRELLGWAKSRSPFYRDRFRCVEAESFTEAGLVDLPLLTKAELMGNFDDLVTDKRLNLAGLNRHIESLNCDDYCLGRYRVVSTSGSTGQRALFAYDWDEWCTFAAVATRWISAETLQYPVGYTTASFFAANPRHISGALHSFFHGLPGDADKPYIHLPASLPLTEIVRRLNGTDPMVLSGYPSMVLLLALESAAGRLSISPRHISTCGEQCGPEVLAAARKAWGVGVYDYWGCTEGAYAFPCEVGAGMHLPDDMVVVEVVDAEGMPVPEGTLGEKILMTVLYNRTEPLIRYEVGDRIAVTKEVCSCGCCHSRISQIAGRTMAFFRYTNGVVVHWLGMMSTILAADWVSEYQVRQTPNGVEIRVKTTRQHDFEPLRAQFCALLREAGLNDPDVTVVEVASVDRLWSGKLQAFVPL